VEFTLYDIESPATLYEEMSAFPVEFVSTGGTSSEPVRLKPNLTGPCARTKLVDSFVAMDSRSEVISMVIVVKNAILKLLY
jgi:hypothetical protein